MVLMLLLLRVTVHIRNKTVKMITKVLKKTTLD